MEGQNNLLQPEIQHGEIQARLIPCAHCEGKGICHSGKDESSCEICTRKVRLFGISSRKIYGIVCSVCYGGGVVEPMTERLNKRIEPLLAIILVYVALFMVWFMATVNNQHFPAILAFSSTLIGSITGYYFGGKKK